MRMKHSTTTGRFILILILFTLITSTLFAKKEIPPLKIGVIGLTHTHVHWILGRPNQQDINIVGIVEPNRQLAERYSKQHGFAMDIVYNTMDEMITARKPEAVTAFGTIYEHLEVVKTCAPLGIHVMVEKPLAISMEHASQMQLLAKKYNIHLLTNYETTWYASNKRDYSIVQGGAIGDLRKIVVHSGHKGPAEIGINKEFLDWLVDPAQNGAGALTDFGCYGLNLIAWLTQGKRPDAVLAITQTFKPALYPNVDDEATILLKYPKMQGIIQASWNWPIARKDMEIYGQTGAITCENRSDIRLQLKENLPEKEIHLPDLANPYDDPFAFFAAVINKKVQMEPYDLSSLENNMLVVELMEAAKTSSKSGMEVRLKK